MSLDRELRNRAGGAGGRYAVPAPDLRRPAGGGPAAAAPAAGRRGAGDMRGGRDFRRGPGRGGRSPGQRDTRGASTPGGRRCGGPSRPRPLVRRGHDRRRRTAGRCPRRVPLDGAGQDSHLWYHGGSTVLTTPRDGTYRVADGRLTPMGTRGGERSRSATTGGPPHGDRPRGDLRAVSRLEVYEVATAEEVATTRIPGISWHLAGIDDRGRVYVTVGRRPLGDLEVRMYDTRSEAWTRVSGVPARRRHGIITYVTADGFAVRTPMTGLRALTTQLPLASVEGVVDAEGRFVPQREVPIGRGRWSPDRSSSSSSDPRASWCCRAT